MYNDDDLVRCFRCGRIIEGKEAVTRLFYDLKLAWCTDCEDPEENEIEKVEIKEE